MTAALILPGLDGAGTLRAAFAEQLSPRLRPILVSFPADRPLGYAELQQHVWKQLPAGEPFIIIGESFSGPLACRLAAAHPDGLKALVLCASFAKAPLPWLTSLLPLLKWMPIHPAPGALLSWGLFNRCVPHSQLTALQGALANTHAEVLRTRIAEVIKVDASQALAAIKVPVLGLRAGADRLIGMRCWRNLQLGLADFGCVTIEGPHALLQSAPEPCARHIIEFCIRRQLLDA